MKKSLWVLALLALVFSAGFFLESNRSRYAVIRAAATTGSESLAGYAWGSRDTASIYGPIPSKWNGVILYFAFSGSANDTAANVQIYGYTRNGPAIFLWQGDLIAGSATDDNSDNLADTITTDYDYTPGGVTLCDGGGANRVSTVRFDVCELDYLDVQFAGAISAGNVDVYATGY